MPNWEKESHSPLLVYIMNSQLANIHSLHLCKLDLVAQSSNLRDDYVHLVTGHQKLGWVHSKADAARSTSHDHTSLLQCSPSTEI